jgi:hypothetical protein
VGPLADPFLCAFDNIVGIMGGGRTGRVFVCGQREEEKGGRPGGGVGRRQSRRGSGQQPVVADEQEGELRRGPRGGPAAEREQIADPVAELEAGQGGRPPHGTSYRRQYVSPAVAVGGVPLGVTAGGAIARVRVAARGGGLLAVGLGGVVLAGVPDEDGLLLDGVAPGAVGGAHIDAVLVVEAAAGGIALDDDVAHGDGGGRSHRRRMAGQRERGLEEGGFEEPAGRD